MAARRTVAAPVGLLEACDDRRLLGVKLYPRQRELLRLVEENPTTCALCGRQGGKTFCAACFLAWNLLLRPDLDEIAGARPAGPSRSRTAASRQPFCSAT